MAKKKKARKSRPRRTGSKTSLKDFLSELAINPEKLGSFIHNPEESMKSAQLDEEDQDALKSGFAGMIYARLAGVPTEEAFGTKGIAPHITMLKIYPVTYRKWPLQIYPFIYRNWPLIIFPTIYSGPRPMEQPSSMEWSNQLPYYPMPNFQSPFPSPFFPCPFCHRW